MLQWHRGSRAMIGDKLGPFTITDKLGAGAMGVVYRATWEPSGQVVAVKVIHHDHAAKANAAERFDRESDILKQFRHPNIVRHIGVGFSRARNLQYYAMEYVPGKTLEQILEERGSLPWPEVITFGVQIAEALEYAKERGIVHRDLKPSNLMVTRQGQVKLTDFGIAKDLDRTALTADGRTLGTAAYMAPEQIRGTPEISHKTDLYALGCLLYQMLTGRTPFEGKSAMVLMHKHLDEPPPRPSERNPEIPLALDKLVVQLMAKNRDDRPWDAQVVVGTLTELHAKQVRNEPVPMVFGDPSANPTRLGTGATAEPPGPPTSTRRTRRGSHGRGRTPNEAGSTSRGWYEVAGLLAALVLLGSLIGYLLWPPSAEYLHRKAGEAMASELRADWIFARDRYLNVLDRRHPDHPYKNDVRAWRDQILLGDVKRRARILESPGLTGAPEPRNLGEAEFLRTLAANRLDEEGDQFETIAIRWREMAGRLAPETEEERGWRLLAIQRADEARAKQERRRQEIRGLLNEAAEAYEFGRYDRAAEIHARIVRDHEAHADVSDLVAEAMALRTGVVIPSPPPDPATPAGVGVAGFENTPIGATMAFYFVRRTGDIPSLRRITTEMTDAALSGLLTGIPRVPPDGHDALRREIMNSLRVRLLTAGEEVTLPDGTTHLADPEAPSERSALVVIQAPSGEALAAHELRLVDRLWRVIPDSPRSAEGGAESDTAHATVDAPGLGTP